MMTMPSFIVRGTWAKFGSSWPLKLNKGALLAAGIVSPEVVNHPWAARRR